MSKIIHISTTSSFTQGVDIPNSDCPICKHVSSINHGWVSSDCGICGYSSEFDCLPMAVRTLRYRTRLSRTQMAEALGYTRKTVRHYEWTRTSNVYWEKFKTFIEEFYKV